MCSSDLAAKRATTAAVAGQAGQASAVEELKKGGDSPFKVSAFTDIETVPWLTAIGILELMGGEVAPVNFLPFYLVDADSVGSFPPQAGTLG